MIRYFSILAISLVVLDPRMFERVGADCSRQGTPDIRRLEGRRLADASVGILRVMHRCRHEYRSLPARP